MSGCEMPVIIVSGSGNQGMTASLPVIEYAKALNASEEQLLRAVALSDLITIHQKTPIGRLSAFCGAVSAGVGAATGIAYLHGGDFKVIAHTIANALAICSGMICDGAKPSCALKLTSGVSTTVLSAMLAMQGNCVSSIEGIIDDDVDQCVSNLVSIGAHSMNETDKQVLDIMVGKSKK
jgi:L-cysteine desulfidase